MSRYGERTRIGEAVSALGRKPDAGIGYGVATGGTAISPDPTINGIVYRVLQFTGDGTLTVTKAGIFDVLLVGGGGPSLNGFGTGGGGGGWQSATFYVTTNVSIVIGAGATANQSSVTGSTSRFGDFLSCGGGGSCDGALDTSVCGASNGGVRSGGPNSRNFTVGQGTGGTTGRGGSGAGGVQSGDTGGAGKQVNTIIGGASLLLAAGGQGGIAGNGTVNTGNGGNGGGGAGGSGVCYVRFAV